jgi:hypothetical protein
MLAGVSRRGELVPLGPMPESTVSHLSSQLAEKYMDRIPVGHIMGMTRQI